MEHVLVITAAGGVPDTVSADAVAALSAAGVAAGAPARLAASAVEIGLPGPLPGGCDAQAMAGGAPVDATVVRGADRRKRLLVADMDSTIIGVECIDELADYAGVKGEVAAITEAAMRGELDFEAALRARVRLLAGLPEAVLETCFRERVRLNAGARRLVRTMAGQGAATLLVSGGFTYFSERVAAAAGFAGHRANRLGIVGGRLTGEVEPPVLGPAAKLAAMEAEMRRLATGAAAVVAVGDGANDLDIVRAAGLGVAYRAKPALAAEADARLVWSDLTAILALQGIPERDWLA